MYQWKARRQITRVSVFGFHQLQLWPKAQQARPGALDPLPGSRVCMKAAAAYLIHTPPAGLACKGSLFASRGYEQSTVPLGLS